MRHIPDRPLDPLPSIKIKLSALIVGAVGITVFVFWFGVRILGLWASASGIAAAVVALVLVRFVARGLTTPLREMAEATQAMAKGDYSRRVTDTSRDEIGRLARSFNRMAAELAETDRVRRDLVANVSHELRTPLTALQATLENIVDGVATADPDTLVTMLTQVERLGRLVDAAARPLPARGRHGAARPPGLRGRAGARARGARAEAARAGRRDRDDGRRARPRGRRRSRARPPGGREPARERGAALPRRRRGRGAGPPHRDGRHDRGHRRRPRASPTRRSTGSSNGSTGPTRPARRATVVPVSASPSPAGSSTCTAARSTPSGGSLTAAAWSSPCPAPTPLRFGPDAAPHRRDPDEPIRDGRRSPEAHPARRDGPRRRRRRPRERGRPHDGRRVGHARGGQLHAALGAGSCACRSIRRTCSASTSRRWCPPAAPAATPRSPVSIDHVGSGSGIGAADRAHTIKKIVDPSSRPSDFIQPGHVFPLRARPGGVLERRGHTEAAVDLPPRRPRARRR